MDAEIAAIEKNNTWKLVELPKGQKTISVKWVYKTKLKENGEVDKYKARLVAKGYKQEYGVDYKEVFAPVARHDTIRLIISLAAQNSWPIFHLDVKSAFLHGNLEERNCNSVSTPTKMGLKLIKNPGGKKVARTLYKKIVGSLMYLTATRPDIMYFISLINRYMECPTETHLLAAKEFFDTYKVQLIMVCSTRKGKRQSCLAIQTVIMQEIQMIEKVHQGMFL